MTELYKKWSMYLNYNRQTKALVDKLPEDVSDEIFKILEFLVENVNNINSSQEKINQFFEELPMLLITDLHNKNGVEIEPNLLILGSIYNPLVDEFMYKLADELYYTKDEILINLLDEIDFERLIIKIKQQFNIPL